MMRLVLLASLALLPLAQARCSCSCSAQVIPFCTRGGQIYCSPTCAHHRSDYIPENIAREARTSAVQQAPKCTNMSLTQDAKREGPMSPISQESLHSGGRNDVPSGVTQFQGATNDWCRAQIARYEVAKLTNRHPVNLLMLSVPSNTTPPTIPSCDPDEKYPSFNGSCNNCKNPRQGAANTPYVRYLCPAYGDGVNSERRAMDGSELPSARKLREELIKYASQKTQSDSISVLFVPFTQLMAHDTLFSLFLRGARGLNIFCCKENATTSSKRSPLDDEPSSCLSVKGPDNNCISVVRGVTIFNDGACFGNTTYVGPGEKINGQSSYLHLSPVYGSSDDTANSLRGEEGKLREDALPCFPPKDPNKGCAPRPYSSDCYVSGDVRMNQNPPLTVIQILFFCCHNKIAKELKKINPHWSNDTLYHESRMILIGGYQHIIYTEIMPIMIGREDAEKYDLIPRQGCHEDEYCYDDQVDATTSNEFAAACFRLFHSTIPSTMRLRNDDPSDQCPVTDLHMSDTMHDSDQITHPSCRFGQMENLMLRQPAQSAGDHLTIEMSEWMFRILEGSVLNPGEDLGAFDIQRGRDHGLPSYCSYLFSAHGHCCSSWDDLRKYISWEHVRKLMELYKNPNDVDFYVGAILEKTEDYNMFGPTCREILIDDMIRKKKGDKFFYLNIFKTEKLCEIKKMTMARLMCDCGKHIKEIQPLAFLLPSRWNRRVNCDQIPKMSFTPWKE